MIGDTLPEYYGRDWDQDFLSGKYYENKIVFITDSIPWPSTGDVRDWVILDNGYAVGRNQKTGMILMLSAKTLKKKLPPLFQQLEDLFTEINKK